MGDSTHIGWTEATWNPWYGCTKISPGCKFCYMYRDMQRYGRDPFTVQRSKTTFNDPLKWADSRMVFTCSWSDFFIESADAWRDEAWDIIRRTPHLTYQILTKRPELINARLPKDWGYGYPNVWLGVSVESQKYADERIPQLITVPARIKFLSIEPLLEPLSFRWMAVFGQPFAAQKKDADGELASTNHLDGLRLIDWGIVGGESGSDRQCEVTWITDVVDEFHQAGVPIFVKQDSGPKPGQQGRIPDSHWVHEFPTMSTPEVGQGPKRD